MRQNFRVGKLLQLCTKYTIHRKTFVMHQAVAIMYCTQQVIQGENFHNRLKVHENRESFPTRKFCCIRYIHLGTSPLNNILSQSHLLHSGFTQLVKYCGYCRYYRYCIYSTHITYSTYSTHGTYNKVLWYCRLCRC